MGLDVSAHAIIGVKVPVEQIFKKVKVKSFDHNMPEDWSVDPKTGKQLWYSAWRFIGAASSPDDEYEYEYPDLYIDWADYPERRPNFVIVVGASVSTDSHRHSSHSPNRSSPLGTDSLLKASAKVQSVLEPLGLWSNQPLELFAIADVSA
jgi:hypothetical protein